ncbi:outer membrane autotransporter barrel domain-containing protein [Polaromonas sp. YR568]|uniref:autotransporter family protein n=1 Tax=Polaromonas sp. YR568 TaxID=1855301 RepID=UPI0008DFC221|nr:autotransporter outer membrane beta-barrel domain-containing protein [Polaromonas sp. YR568]SFU48518.1 outer membrane autotransporter barrel domain-containing protein [Polaromonas sp. YR568]
MIPKCGRGSFCRSILTSSTAWGIGAIAVLAGGAVTNSRAACLPTTAPGSGITVTCSGTDVGSTTVVAAPGSTNVIILVDTGALLTTNATQGLLVRDGSTITNNGQITISGGAGTPRFAIGGSGNNNILINNGSLRTTSASTAGISIAVGGSSTGTQIINTGSITTTGGSSHGILTFGPGNSITNSGSITVSGTGSKGVFLQGGNLVANVLVNTGTIRASGANGASDADGVHANTTGATFFSRVENRAGGSIVSANSYALRGQNGNDTFVNAGYLEGHGGAGGGDAITMGATLGTGTLILQTGSVIRGAADGGIVKRSNTFLEGSGTVDNNFRNFQNLIMRGTAWSWLTNASFSDGIQVQTGTFTFSSTLTSPVIAVQAGSSVAGTGTFVGNVTSQGTLLPGPGAGNGFGALTVRGNYTGSNALLQLNAVLGTDNSPVDQLVIDGGAASGNTGIQVVNRGGVGGRTTSDGLLVVQAVNGASTGSSAFALAQPVQAGAYDYRLFKGGATGNNPDNWYLRSTAFAVAGVVVATQAQAAALAAASNAPIEAVSLYRPEVALYSSIPMAVRQGGLMQLGTFHQRQGGQRLLAQDGARPASWARVFGQALKQSQDGDASPQFDGTVSGLQAGHDFYLRDGEGSGGGGGGGGGGGYSRAGLLAGYTSTRGDASGFVGGLRGTGAGRLSVDGYSLGGYWSRVEANGAYADMVLMATLLRVNTRSVQTLGGNTRANALTASAEAGYPLALGEKLVLETQAQLIWQRTTFNDFDDGVSSVHIERDNALTGRVGARLRGALEGSSTWRPYLLANLWHTFKGNNGVTFGGVDTVAASRTATALELGVGLTAQMNARLAFYGGLSSLGNIGGAYQQGGQVQVGLKYLW